MFDGLCLALAVMGGLVIALGTLGALVAGDWSSPMPWLALWFIGVGGYCVWPWLRCVLHPAGPDADES